jgi:hypothetical protein
MKLPCGILVVGAGSAGVPAALAAARAGADTILVEKTAEVGGVAVTGLHRFICGLYANGPDAPASLLNADRMQAGLELLAEPLAQSAPVRLGRVDLLPYDRAAFQATCERLLAAQPNLRLLRESPVRSVALSGRRVRRVVAGDAEIEADFVIDCSGDGAVIRAHPDLHEIAPAAERQLAGAAVRLRNLRNVRETLAIEVPYTLRQGVEAGALPGTARFASFSPGDAPDEGFCKFSLPASDLPDDRLACESVLAQVDFLRRHLDSFQSATVVEASTGALQREGARLKGRYTLTADDVLQSRTFPDAVARNAWPIECWDPVRGPAFRYLPPGAWHEIPAGALQARAVDNLFAAGRCLSATPDALASARVLGVCLALGEAAGRLAAERCAG